MGARQLVTAWTSGLSVTLPGRGLRWPPSEQPPSSTQPPWAARRLHGGRARLALTVRARLALTVRAWRRRRALHVLVTDVPSSSLLLLNTRPQVTHFSGIGGSSRSTGESRRLRAAPCGGAHIQVDQLGPAGKRGRTAGRPPAASPWIRVVIGHCVAPYASPGSRWSSASFRERQVPGRSLIGRSTGSTVQPAPGCQRRGAPMWPEVRSLTRQVRIELEDKDGDSSWAM
jgi:hypothetical protein